MPSLVDQNRKEPRVTICFSGWPWDPVGKAASQETGFGLQSELVLPLPALLPGGR